MPVTLDAPAAKPAHAGHGPIWRVGCDGCRDRLYLAGYSAQVAVHRAVVEYGWRMDGNRIWCHRRHRHG